MTVSDLNAACLNFAGQEPVDNRTDTIRVGSGYENLDKFHLYSNPNMTSISSAVFAGHRRATDRPHDTTPR